MVGPIGYYTTHTTENPANSVNDNLLDLFDQK